VSSFYAAWWNVENLFDIENSPDRTEKLQRTLANELRGWDERLLFRKVDQLATIINKMNEGKGPDLLGICEVESRGVLDRLRRKVESLSRRNYDLVHADTQDERGIDVAFLYDTTKFEVEPGKVFFHTIVKRVATREIVQVNFKSKATGNRIVLVGNHWPSRSGGQLESEPFRLISGETLAYFNQRIQEVHGEDTSVLIMGDFNDEPFNRSITEHALGTADKDKVTRSRTAPRLYNLMWSFAAKAQGTFYFDGFNLLDQIMVSKGILTSEGKFGIDPNSAQILNFDEIMKNGKPRKFGRPSDSQGVDEQGYSDHYPIAVKIVEE
jgi:predicted extracellular nuclease